MLDYRRRAMEPWRQPIVAIPKTRTTTTRRTRRMSFDIETNGVETPRSRRKRTRALPDPYFLTHPPVYGGNPWTYGDWRSNETFNSYGNFVDPFNRLYAGGENEYAPVNELYSPEDEEESLEELHNNNSDQKAFGDLRDILMELEGYLQEENNREPEPNEVPEHHNPQNNQFSALTDLIYDTVGKLNTYMTTMLKNNEHLQRVPPPVQMLQLPVQPLILPPMFSNSTAYPSNYPYVEEPEFSPSESKTLYPRLPWLKERKRKRPSKTVTHVYLQSQSCSTDDLDVLPRILEASNSRDSRVSMNSLSPPMKEASTTMWCSMKCCTDCCTDCCDLVTTQKEEKPLENFEIPSPMKISDHILPSILKAPPPSIKSEDDMDRDHEMDIYHPPSKLIYPPTSSYNASCDYPRHTGGNVLYSCVKVEKEEQLQVEEAEEEHVDEDEWYQGASHKLAELELEQEYFKEMQKQSQVNTTDQEQQTDLDISTADSLVNVIVTTDKAVSTTDLNGLTNREPVKIVRIYKRSSLKPRHRLISSSNPRGKSKASHKVKFEKLPPTPNAPEIKTIGRHPMDCEDTARSVKRISKKRSNSSTNSKEK